MPNPPIEPGRQAEAARTAALAVLDADKAHAIDYPRLLRHMLTGKPVRTVDLITPRELRARLVVGMTAAAHLLKADHSRGVELVAYAVSHGQVTSADGVGYAVFLGVGTADGLEVNTHLGDPDDARQLGRALLLNAIELERHQAGATRCHDDDEPAPPVLADEDRDLAVAWLRARANLLDADALVDDEHRGEGCARAAELRAAADLIGTNAHRIPPPTTSRP